MNIAAGTSVASCRGLARTVLPATCALVGALLLGGCGSSGGAVGPDVMVNPQYHAGPQMSAVAGNKLAVAVNVVDARTTPVEKRPDGREVLAQGDKGKIFLARPAPKVIEQAMTSSLQAAGFIVSPDAPVVVDVSLVDLPLQAFQFTHWNLPSERASTLDALGMFMPGPVRETKAKVAMNVVIRKNNARLGFSHVIGADANNKSDDKSIVSQTVDDVINRAVDDAVVKSAPDIDIVTRTPVTAKEIGGREDEIARQQQQIKELNGLLASRESTVVEDRKALEDMRNRLVEDQQVAQKTLASERAAVIAQRADLDKEREGLKAKLVELTAKSESAPGVKEALGTARQQQQAADAKAAALDAAQAALAGDRETLDAQRATLANERAALKTKLAELSQKPETAPGVKEALATAKLQQQATDAKAAALDQASAQLDERRKEVQTREQNLKAYSARLDDQAAGNKTLSTELTLRTRELDERERALTTWKADLEKRVEVKPPTVIIEKHAPLILITEPAALRTETTLPQVTVSGVAIDDRKVARLSATINGQPVPSLSTLTEPSGRGVGLRAIPTLSEPAGESGMASRPFSFTTALKEGPNEVVIEAVDDDNLHTVQKLTVNFDRSSGRIYVVSIGINDYQNRDSVPPLRFAVADAKDIAATFQKLLGSGDTQVRQMLDSQATRANVVKQLFEQLPSEVRPQDTVVIFFSGHGAPDASTDAQGNVETFLLPIDADPSRLFSTAIRMHDVATILRRLRSERIIFLADTCYSGAAAAGVSGARTVAMPGLAMKGGVGIKAIPDRPRGKGCAVITASSGIQVAQEKNEVAHGVFTYYLLLGLAGAADTNHDGQVTVDELFEYVRVQVSKETAGKQTPQISRDDTAGDIVLSRVAK